MQLSFSPTLMLLAMLKLFIFQALSFSQVNKDTIIHILINDSTQLCKIKPISLTNLVLPKADSIDIIEHTGFSFLYNERHEQASWIAYDLTKENTIKSFERTDKFIPDPKVKTGTACGTDYVGSGYDRGHLAPASDMGYSSITMAESFYYSNMCPQTPSFNRGIWKRLEELTRSWAVENNTIHIVTGPILTDSLLTIGENKVSVPNYFYKVILDYSEPSVKSIAFIMPNIGSKEQLQFYAVSIDSVEKVTGIDFFPLIPDEDEELIEKTICIDCWSWKSSNTYGYKKDTNTVNSKDVTDSVQCSGTTKAGNRCKNKTLNQSGYCYHHEGQVK